MIYLQGDFFNWASPEFAKCWPVSDLFQKNVNVPDWPPLGIKNVKVFGISPLSAAILRTFSKWVGASQGVFWGGQSRDIFRGGPVKKITLYMKDSFEKLPLKIFIFLLGTLP